MALMKAYYAAKNAYPQITQMNAALLGAGF
jgi:hypothetical protein